MNPIDSYRFFLCIDFHVYGGGANHKRENHAPGQACQTAEIRGPSCNCAPQGTGVIPPGCGGI